MNLFARSRIPSWEDEERLSFDHLRDPLKRVLVCERLDARAHRMRRHPARKTHDGTSVSTLFVDFVFDPARAHTRTVLGLSLVRKSWATAMSDLLDAPSSSRFWQRMLMFRRELVLHPELDAPRMLEVYRVWLTGEDRILGFVPQLANAFCFFTNIDIEEGARPIGWTRLAVNPWLEGTELAQEGRETYVARLIDTLLDFEHWHGRGSTIGRELHSVYRSLVDFLRLETPARPIYAANWNVTMDQTELFCDLIRKFAPLFPQEPRLEEDRHGEERHVLVPCKWNRLFRVDEMNTNEDQSFWNVIEDNNYDENDDDEDDEDDEDDDEDDYEDD